MLIFSRVHVSQWPKKSLIEFYWKFQRQIIIIFLVCTDWSDVRLCDSKIILEVYMTGILRRKAQLKTPSTIHNGQLYCQNMNDIKQLAKRYSLQYTGKTIEENLKQAYERVLEDWNSLTENFELKNCTLNSFPIWVIAFRWLLFLLLTLRQIDLNAEWAEGVDLLSLFSPIDNIWCANLPGNYRDHKNYPKLYFLGSQIESEKTVVSPWM